MLLGVNLVFIPRVADVLEIKLSLLCFAAFDGF